MKLTAKQKSKIDGRIKVSEEDSIVIIDVSEDKSKPLDENNFNIYRINENAEIIWQVKETKTKVPCGYDMFVYVSMNDKGEITADRFSGLEYKIDPETGEAECIGFHK